MLSLAARESSMCLPLLFTFSGTEEASPSSTLPAHRVRSSTDPSHARRHRKAGSVTMKNSGHPPGCLSGHAVVAVLRTTATFTSFVADGEPTSSRAKITRKQHELPMTCVWPVFRRAYLARFSTLCNLSLCTFDRLLTALVACVSFLQEHASLLLVCCVFTWGKKPLKVHVYLVLTSPSALSPFCFRLQLRRLVRLVECPSLSVVLERPSSSILIYGGGDLFSSSAVYLLSRNFQLSLGDLKGLRAPGLISLAYVVDQRTGGCRTEPQTLWEKGCVRDSIRKLQQ